MHQIWVRLAAVVLFITTLTALQPLLPDERLDIDAVALSPGRISPLPVLEVEPDRWLDLDAASEPRAADETITLGEPPPALLVTDGTLQLHDLETGETIHIEAATNASFAQSQLFDPTGGVGPAASHFLYRSTAGGGELTTLNVLDLATRERWTLEVPVEATGYDSRLLAASDFDATTGAQSRRFWDLRTGEPLGEVLLDLRGVAEQTISYRIPTAFGYSVQTTFAPPLDDSGEAGSADLETATLAHLLIADDFSWTLGVRGHAGAFVVALDATRALALGVVDDRWVINLVAIPDGDVSLLAHLEPGDTFPQFNDLYRPPDPAVGRHLVWHSCGDEQAAWVYAADEDRLIRLDDTDLVPDGPGRAWTTLLGGAEALVDLDTFEYEFTLSHPGALSYDGRWVVLPAQLESRPSFGSTCR